MTNLFNNLMNDEAGFIVSAELVIIATVGVLAMIVGLSEVAMNVNHELEDVGSAFGSLNQSVHVQGTAGHYANVGGSCHQDRTDYCDQEGDICPSTNNMNEQ